MTYKVREAKPAEIDKIVAIGSRVHSESIYSHLVFDWNKTANMIMGAILKQPGWFCRVIAFEGEPVGGLICYCAEELFTRDKVARDISIMLAPEHRGKCLREIAIMVDEYTDWARAEKAKLIVLGASSGCNTDGASKLFAKLGYEKTGVLHTIRVGV